MRASLRTIGYLAALSTSIEPAAMVAILAAYNQCVKVIEMEANKISLRHHVAGSRPLHTVGISPDFVVIYPSARLQFLCFLSLSKNKTFTRFHSSFCISRYKSGRFTKYETLDYTGEERFAGNPAVGLVILNAGPIHGKHIVASNLNNGQS